MKALSLQQTTELHQWIAKDYPPYPQLRRLMLQLLIHIHFAFI